ncbi:hypothetical protein [Lacinutrix undariae]
MEVSKMNIFTRFNIEDAQYLEKPSESYKVVKLRMRALIFLLDYSLFGLLIYGTSEFITIFISTIPDSILYTLFAFYSIIFIAIEYYFDGTIFKILFNIRNISTRHKKLGIHFYILKFILLRPTAVVAAAIYLNFCTAILLWLFGIQKMLLKFLDGKMQGIWYDTIIDQIVVKTPLENE